MKIGLPKQEMPLGSLWDNLNHRQRHPTPQSTIEALLFSVRERGSLAALDEPANVERLARCDTKAKTEIKRRIEALRAKGLLR
jgi:hypothetical protein